MSPQIRDYTAQVDTLRPTETGVEAYAQGGRRIGAFYNQAGDSEKQAAQDEARAAGAVATAKENVARSVSGIAKSVDVAMKQADDYVTHQEVSHGAATFAQLHSDLTNQWNGIVSNPKTDPNDTSIAGKFRETQLEPAIEQFTNSFHTIQGQQWANAHASALRDHMFEKQSADMSSLAADAVTVNVRKTTNAWSNTARNDPSSVDFLLKTADASIGGIVGSSPNLTGAEAAKVHSQVTQKAKEDIVKAGALGAIEKAADPEKAAKTFADRYPEYVNGQEIAQLASAAKTQNKNNLLTQKQTELAQRQLDEQNVHKASADVMANRVSIDPQTGKASIDPKFFQDTMDIVKKYPNAPNAAANARTMIDWGESQQKPPAVHDDPAAIDSLMKTVGDPSVSLDQAKIAVLKADIGKSITAQTRTQIMQLATDMRSINDPLLSRDLEAAKEMVEPKYSGISVNPGAYAKFYYDFIHNQYLPAKVAGTLPPNALDMNDPKSMISQAVTKATGGPKSTLPAAIIANGGVGSPPLPTYTAPAKPSSNLGTITGIDVRDAPPTARAAGQVYQTPRGPMKWTGTGWVAP